MSKQVQNFIDDARRFQRCSDHDLAISSLQLAQQEDHHKEHEIEIQKLFSLSYRKIGNYNMALLHINNSLSPRTTMRTVRCTAVSKLTTAFGVAPMPAACSRGWWKRLHRVGLAGE